MSLGTTRTGRVLTVLAVVVLAAAAGYLVTWMIFPTPIVAHPVSVPALRGSPARQADSQLTALGLRGRVVASTADPLTPEGTIAWQSPAPETIVPEGAIVRLAVSTGAPRVPVPAVVGLNVDLALQVLGAAGLASGAVDTVRNDADFGTVLGTDPSSGTIAVAGDTVKVTVSSGAALIRVPDLAGLTLDVARQRLGAAGLALGQLTERAEGKPGTILQQHPLPGNLVARETPVDLTLSGMMP